MTETAFQQSAHNAPHCDCWPARRASPLVAAPFSIVRAQGAALKVGVLLPRSGFQAGIGQDCQRGVEIASRRSSRASACPSSQIMNADTETNVEVARARAEKLIADGAQLLVGAFDSGQSTAIAQVAEQKGIPFVINIAAAPPITEQGYKFVFRNFPTAAMILARRLRQSEGGVRGAGAAPKTGGVHARQRHLRHRDEERHRRGDAEVRHAVQDRRDDRLRSGGARPVGRGGEGQGDRRRGAAGGQPAQRRDPADARTGQAALVADGDPQHGPGLVRGPVSQDARQAVRRPAELRALVRPEQEADQAARGRARPRRIRASTSTPTTSTRSRRCWSPPTPTSAPARPIRRRWPTPSARPTSPTTSAPVPASRSTPRARTTS